VEILRRQQLGLPLGEPLGASEALAFGTMPVAAGNGRCPLPALWANPVMGSWRAASAFFGELQRSLSP
jgi:hypothetical protein